MTRTVCPVCGQFTPETVRPLTERELEVLMHWWLTGSLRRASQDVGVGEQRAKNLMARARIRSGVDTNDQLLAMHLDAVRSLVAARIQHNPIRSEAS